MRLILVVPTSFKGRKRDALKHAKVKSRQLKLSQRKKKSFCQNICKNGSSCCNGSLSSLLQVLPLALWMVLEVVGAIVGRVLVDAFLDL